MFEKFVSNSDTNFVLEMLKILQKKERDRIDKKEKMHQLVLRPLRYLFILLKRYPESYRFKDIKNIIVMYTFSNLSMNINDMLYYSFLCKHRELSKMLISKGAVYENSILYTFIIDNDIKGFYNVIDIINYIDMEILLYLVGKTFPIKEIVFEQYDLPIDQVNTILDRAIQYNDDIVVNLVTQRNIHIVNIYNVLKYAILQRKDVIMEYIVSNVDLSVIRMVVADIIQLYDILPAVSSIEETFSYIFKYISHYTFWWQLWKEYPSIEHEHDFIMGFSATEKTMNTVRKISLIITCLWGIDIEKRSIVRDMILSKICEDIKYPRSVPELILLIQILPFRPQFNQDQLNHLLRHCGYYYNNFIYLISNYNYSIPDIYNFIKNSRFPGRFIEELEKSHCKLLEDLIKYKNSLPLDENKVS